MNRHGLSMTRIWERIGTRYLPFADVASDAMPLSRLLRLSLFQVSVGMVVVMLTGTLNRVMIVELGVSASLVAFMVALPIVFAPFRVLIGFRSDHRRSVLGWRRVPYLWIGSLMQFGGLAILPFALILLSGDNQGSEAIALGATALAFLLVGLGMHTTQTAGLALATDLVPPALRARVVPLLYVMLLVGMVLSALVFSLLLASFSQLRLIQVIQGAAVLTIALNLTALWKQEGRLPSARRPGGIEGEADATAAAEADPRSVGAPAAAVERPRLRERLAELLAGPRPRRLLLATALGTAGLCMQDILLEPFGAQVMGLGVASTTLLTALVACGTLGGFAWSARWLGRALDPHRLAAIGTLFGLAAFSMLVFAGPLRSEVLLFAAALLMGLGTGLFSVGTLTAAMALDAGRENGLALGVWGAVQATAAGVAIACGGFLRDVVGAIAERGTLGVALVDPATGYSFVYHIEILLLFAALVAVGPLSRHGRAGDGRQSARLELRQFPS